MADDNIQQHAESHHPTPVARADPAVTTAPSAAPSAAAPRAPSEGEQFLRWSVGVVIVLVAGWGFVALVALLAYRGSYPVGPGVAAILAWLLSFAFFLLLERNLWLNRFMRLRTNGQASPHQEAVFLWLFNVVGLMWRSTEGKDAAPADQQTQSEVSTGREVVETVVFVVVLVLLLKSFVAEAFVIPTGSMATTLYGYQKDVECPKCGWVFPVNCSQEVEPQQGGGLVPVVGCTCPNCFEHIALTKEIRDPSSQQRREVLDLDKYPPRTGDRVLVGKFLFDLPWTSPQKHRLNVVVFKYPKKPMGDDFTPTNYIKRLIGLPEETIAIFYGKIYILSPDKGLRFDDGPPDDKYLWEYDHMHVNAGPAMERWNKKEFQILHKPPEVVLAMRRIVYDNDHPAKDLKDYPRWINDGSSKGWSVNDAAHTFQHEAASDPSLLWLRYQHAIGRQGRTRPELITDFMGYNTFEPPPIGQPPPPHWVGDLMVECDVTVNKAEGQLVLELSRGISRYRALFDLATGDCTLKQIEEHKDDAPALADDAGEVLAKQPTNLKKPGTYHVRLANVDNRLLLWVDRSLPFGDDGVPYTPSEKTGPYRNDLQPASVGVQGGGVTVGKLQLWRDTYYTEMKGEGVSSPDVSYPTGLDFAAPDEWGALRHLKPMTFYVQPGHYLCLGDNSPHSADSRVWGLVPDRLMLGRALVVYWPFGRVGPIR